MQYSQNIYFVFALMSAAIILTRVGGYWIAGRIKLNKRVKAWFECLPGCILIAIVLPLLRQADWVSWVAAAVVVYVMIKTNTMLYAMLSGIVVAAVGHAIF